MTRIAISFGVLLVLASCSNPTLLSGEGVACSTSSSADPYRKCDLAEADYVCINTYKVNTTPVWLCRVACTDIRDCKTSTDVCCQAPISGNNLGKTAACVPATDCDPPSVVVPLPMSLMPDGGNVDARMSPRDAMVISPLPSIDAEPLTSDAAPDAPAEAPSDASPGAPTEDSGSDGPL